MKTMSENRQGRVGERLRIALSVLVLTLPWWFTAARALEIGVADVKIPQGEVVAVPIRASDAKGLSALQMRLGFEGEAFEVVEVAAGPTLANALVDFQVAKGSCTIAFAASEPVAKDGDLFIVKMRRRAGADGGATVVPEDVRAWGGDGGQSLPVSVKPGRIAGISPPAAASSCVDWRYVGGGAAALAALSVGAAALALRRRGRSKTTTAANLEPSEPATSGPGPHFCIACGSPLPEGARFCPNCGVRIARSEIDEGTRHPEEPS